MGDFPDGEAERDNRPISGTALMLLEKALPIPVSQCRIMNIAEHKPANNNFDYLEGSDEIRASFAHLKEYISIHPPEVIITLGELPLRYLTGRYNINTWRSSPLKFGNISVLPTYHPRQLVSQKDLFPVFSFDLEKALKPRRIYNDNFSIVTDPLEMYNYIPEILAAEYVTIDIETKRNPQLDLLCVGFGLSNTRAICFAVRDFSTIQILRTIISQIKKPIYHNATFDIGVLRYFHSIDAPPTYFDTMVGQHVLYPEMKKGLDFLCTMNTDRPCYWDGISFDEETKTWSEKRSLSELYKYNCMDVVVTYESFLAQKEELEKHPSREIFEYEMEMLEVALHISSTGFNVDKERKALLCNYMEERKKTDIMYLFALIGHHINTESHTQVKKVIYEELGLPERKDRKGNVTSDNDALVGLISHCKTEMVSRKTDEAKAKWKTSIAILKLLLQIRQANKIVSSYVGVDISNDGRLRGVLKVTGTESGRWAGGVWFDGTGLNTQTLPRMSVEL